MPTVRNVVRDHALDEALHHAYFADVLHVIWPQLTSRQKDLVGRLFPRFMLAFLRPDLTVHRRWLNAVGFNDAEADQIIGDTYPTDQILTGIRAMAHPTINHFRQAGVLDHPAAREALESFGMLHDAGEARDIPAPHSRSGLSRRLMKMVGLI
jgi:hypothetical protein